MERHYTVMAYNPAGTNYACVCNPQGRYTFKDFDAAQKVAETAVVAGIGKQKFVIYSSIAVVETEAVPCKTSPIKQVPVAAGGEA